MLRLLETVETSEIDKCNQFLSARCRFESQWRHKSEIDKCNQFRLEDVESQGSHKKFFYLMRV